MKYFAHTLFCLFLAAGCDYIDETVDSLGGTDTETTDTDTTAKTDTDSDSDSNSDTDSETPTLSKKYHHYNPNAYEMSSSAVSFVLCPGQSFESCKMGEKSFTLHGNQDEGRDSWIYYGEKYLSGTIICKDDEEKSFSFKVSGDDGMQYGDCD